MLRHIAPKMGVVCFALVGMAATPSPRPLPAELTPADIAGMRFFEGVLVPIGAAPSGQENAELGRALEAYRAKGSSENFEPFLDFLKAHPESSWRASLMCNLGGLYYHGGYFTKALDAWDQAFALTRDSKDPQADPIRARAIKELLDLNARVGRVPRVKELLDEAVKRPIPGWMNEAVQGAREGLWLMENKPERAFRCGPLGIAMIKQSLRQPSNELLEENCTPKGTSLSANLALAAKSGLEYQMARREPGAPVLLPALVHWKAGHYAALVQQVGDRFLVKDPTFGEEFWVSRKALDEELSGYALVAKGALPKGWQPVSEHEGGKVWGRGSTPNANQNATNKCDHTTGGACENGAAGCGHPGQPAGPKKMPGYSFHTAVVSLHLADTPEGYTPQVGPEVWFSIVYNQREVRRGEWIDYASVGAQWTHNWDSYVVDDPGVSSVGAQTIRTYDASGGSLSYTGFQSASLSWKAHPKTHETLAAGSDISHPVYTRNLIDGYKLVYSTPDGATTYPRRVYLTQVVDPQGNAVTLHYHGVYPFIGYGFSGYTSSGGSGGGQSVAAVYAAPTGLALDAITDAQGLVTNIAVNNQNFITSVTDPFGRSAQFTYDGAHELSSVTDVGGLTTTFNYGYIYNAAQDLSVSLQRIVGTWQANPCGTCSGQAVASLVSGQIALPDFLASMTTPYGTTTFDMWENGTQRAIQATDPLGNTERLEFRHNAPGIASTETFAAGGVDNIYLNYRNSFYWNKRIFAAYGQDYTKAHLFHWLHGLDGEFNAPTLESERDSLDRRTWYGHDGNYSYVNPTETHPTGITRTLPDGHPQAWKYAYNAQGKTTQATDPLGRVFSYQYSADGLDLLSVHNITGNQDDLLGSYTYNVQHLPLTVTDSAGQVSTLTYTALGQLSTLTNAKGQTTTYTYANNRLSSIVGPDPAATVSFGYDAFNRVADVTDAEGRTIHTDFDVFDRPLKVSYPDGTFEAFTYDRLDLIKVRDRKGQSTVMTYNPLRQLVEVLDSAGRSTQFSWCGCGSLESLVDPAGHFTTWIRDLQSRVVSKVYDDKTQTSYAYDEVGRLKSRADTMGQLTAYTYNWDNSLARVDYTSATRPTPPVAYTYDARYPRMATMSDAYGTTAFAYYPVSAAQLGSGRLASVDGPWANDTITYTYDELGRVVSRSLNGSQENRVFDALGRLSTVVNPLGSFTYAYQGATGRLDSVTAPNGMVSSFAYSASPNDRRVQQIQHKRADGSLISSFAYTYDADGQIQTWTQAADTQAPKTYSFSYDAVGQVLGAQLTGPTGDLIHQYAYAYDAAGNRTSEQVDGAETVSDYNAVNQLTQHHYSAGSQAQSFRASQLQSRAAAKSGKSAPGKSEPGKSEKGKARKPSRRAIPSPTASK